MLGQPFFLGCLIRRLIGFGLLAFLRQRFQGRLFFLQGDGSSGDIERLIRRNCRVFSRATERASVTRLELLAVGFQTLDAVSYTHRDVYKRQGQERPQGIS